MDACILQGTHMHSILTFAYLDPGTGSMLLQAIVGGGAGIMVLVRHFWRTVRISRKTVDAQPSGVDA